MLYRDTLWACRVVLALVLCASMNDQRVRYWGKRPFYDPEQVLRDLRALELDLADVEMNDLVRRLRTGRLKSEREARDAALFTHGMSVACGTKFFVSPGETEDADCITVCGVGDEQIFTPVQLKELAPADLNPTATIQDLIAGLAQKPPTDTVLAIRLNRRGSFDFNAVDHSSLPYAEIWYFGSTTPDSSQWFLCGNVLSIPRFYEFVYPT
jgi:hypothetical protein